MHMEIQKNSDKYPILSKYSLDGIRILMGNDPVNSGTPILTEINRVISAMKQT